jgi:LacI family transcriptional regulator
MKHVLSRLKYPHVAVCVDKSRSYGRGVMQGIADYLEIHGPWALSIDPGASGNYQEGWLKNWRGDGVIAFIEDPAVAEDLRRAGIPAVEVFRHHVDLGLPQVGNDEAKIGRLAAEHLLDRKFSKFAFCGYRNHLWSDLRREGFEERVRRGGGSSCLYESVHTPARLADWEQGQEELIVWLRQLPKPVGLMACSDAHALRILDACHRAQLAVPEEVAVIGVDNDEETCRLANPPLSSVIDHPRRVGFEAARLLGQIMVGAQNQNHDSPLLIAPLGVATRRSTDTTAIEDPMVARAAQIIREHACKGLTVKDLVSQMRMSHTTLYERFQAALGLPPHQAILKTKLDRVKNLLKQTDLSLEQIAEHAGFNHAEYMQVAFKREVGTTPGKYRRAA